MALDFMEGILLTLMEDSSQLDSWLKLLWEVEAKIVLNTHKMSPQSINALENTLFKSKFYDKTTPAIIAAKASFDFVPMFSLLHLLGSIMR